MTSRAARIKTLRRMIERRRAALEALPVARRPRLDPLPRVDDAEALFTDGLALWSTRRGMRGFPKHLHDDPDGYAYQHAKADIEQRFLNAGWGRPQPKVGYHTFAEYDEYLATRQSDADDPIDVVEYVSARTVLNPSQRDEDDTEYVWDDAEAQTIRDEDRWREYIERVDREQGRATRMMDDALRTALFEEHLQAVLDPDEYETWVHRREMSLKALAALRGVSEQAVFYREQPIVQRARVEWAKVNPEVPLPPILLRRPRHDAPRVATRSPGARLK